MKHPNKFSMYIRSGIFSAIVPVYTIIWSLVCLSMWPFSLRMRYQTVVVWTNSVVWLLKVICCVNYKVDGLENIPKDRSVVVMSKHQSTWETFFLPHYFERVAIILKRELLWVPFFGWAMAVINPIMINRSDKSSAMSQILTQGKACLEDGRSILIFPEGTRIAYGKEGKYRLGGARLAVVSGHPILPVAHNAGKYWPRRKFLKTPGTVHIVFGPLIESVNKTPEELLAETKDWIEATCKRIN